MVDGFDIQMCAEYDNTYKVIKVKIEFADCTMTTLETITVALNSNVELVELWGINREWISGVCVVVYKILHFNFMHTCFIESYDGTDIIHNDTFRNEQSDTSHYIHTQ